MLQSPWNKYKGQRRERAQIWKEIHKAVPPRSSDASHTGAVSSDAVPNADQASRNGRGKLNPISFRQFVTSDLPTPSWLVEGIWSNKAHGLVAGEAKAYKTLLCLDLVVSVASGTKFLGHFEVPKQGPVIVIQNENSPSLVQDRVTKIARSRGLVGGVEDMKGSKIRLDFTERDLPIHFLNNVELNLGDEDDLDELDELLTKVRPEMVVLDPWYLMTPGVDENVAAQVTPILDGLMQLKRKHDTGILMVHHYRKQNYNHPSSGGERISGTSVFYRWVESALYVEKGPEPGTARVTPEHREFPHQGVIDVEFEVGDFGDYGRDSYHVFVEYKKEENKTLAKEMKLLVDKNPGITIREVADALAIREDRVRRLVEKGPYRTRKLKAEGRGRPPYGIFVKPLSR